MWLASFGSAAVLAVIVQTPIISQTFGCTPLDPFAWATAITAATTATAVSTIAQRLMSATPSPSRVASPLTGHADPGAGHPVKLVTA